MREKIFLAVGERDFEDYLKQTLKNRYDFVGETTHREGIVPGVKNNKPDIVVIRETLDGKVGIMDVLYMLRDKYPDVRIILIASPRDRGDKFLATLIQYGVYDFTATATTNIRDIIRLIDVPNKYEDIKGYIPKPELDEKTGKIIFKAPEVEPEVVIKEVVIKEGEPKKKKAGLFESLNEFLKVKEDELPENSKKESAKRTVKRASTPKKEDVEAAVKGNPLKSSKRKIYMEEPEDRTEEKEIVLNSSDRIISFVSGRSGCGATSIALNTSILLAQRGFKVVLLECNSVSPSIAYWFDLGKNSEGIDTCLDYIANYEYGKIPKTIIKSEIIKTENSSLQKNYKLFPNGLDFMFFSKEYISGIKKELNIKYAKDLYIHLMFQQGYDFVILDLPSDLKNEFTKSGLIFCNKVYSVLTQDISSIGYYLMRLYELQSDGIEIVKKNNFIINKYVNGASVGKDFISKWISSDNILVIPDTPKLFIEANAKAVPAVILGDNTEYKKIMEDVSKSIFKKN